MTDGRQPGKAHPVGVWVIVFCQDPTHSVFIDLDTERLRDLFCDFPTTESWIAPLHFNNCRNDLL